MRAYSVLSSSSSLGHVLAPIINSPLILAPGSGLCRRVLISYGCVNYSVALQGIYFIIRTPVTNIRVYLLSDRL